MFNFWEQLKEALGDITVRDLDSNEKVEFANISLPVWVAKSLLDDKADEEEHVSALLQHIDMLEDYTRLLRKENEELRANALE